MSGRGPCGGGHAMRRDPEGPPDRPWRCVRPGCDAVQPWGGGAEGWAAVHGPKSLAAPDPTVVVLDAVREL